MKIDISVKDRSKRDQFIAMMRIYDSVSFNPIVHNVGFLVSFNYVRTSKEIAPYLLISLIMIDLETQYLLLLVNFLRTK